MWKYVVTAPFGVTTPIFTTCTNAVALQRYTNSNDQLFILYQPAGGVGRLRGWEGMRSVGEFLKLLLLYEESVGSQIPGLSQLLEDDLP